MRKIAFILVALPIVLALAACYWVPREGTGELTVRLAGGTRGLGDYAARVWLLTEDNALVPIGASQDYAETALSQADTQVTVEKIPAGPRYRVLLSLGTVEDGWFRVEEWAESEPFEVSAGSTVNVPVSLEASPFDYGSEAVMGEDLRGLVVSTPEVGDDDILYAVSPTTLFSGTDAAGMTAAEGGNLPAGHTANSLSIGIAIQGETDVWVNTTRGILPYIDVPGSGGFDTILTANLGDGAGVSILESGGFIDSATGAEFLFFQRDGGLGGADISPYYGSPVTPLAADQWVDIDVSEFITGQPVQDFYVDMTSEPAKAYFVTKLGAFGADSGLLDPSLGDDDPDLESLVTFFGVEKDSIPTILAIEKGSSTDFLLGTADGVWTTPDPIPAEGEASFTPIPATRGYSFHKLAASDFSWAALSPYYLFVSDGVEVEKIPFSAGLPGKVSAMVWNGDTLVIAGSEGLVAYSPAQ